MTIVTRQPSMQIARPTMLNLGQNVAQRWRLAVRRVRRHPLRIHLRCGDRPFQEGFTQRVPGRGVSALGDGGVNRLSIRINGALDIGPATLQADIPCIDAPPIAEWSAIGTGSFLKQGEQALDPPIDRAAIHDETTFGDPRDDIRLAQAVAHGVADGHGTHVVGNAVMREGAAGACRKTTVAGGAPPALPAQPRLSIPPCPRACSSHIRHDQSLST